MAKTKHAMELWYVATWSAGANRLNHQVWRQSEQLGWQSIFDMFDVTSSPAKVASLASGERRHRSFHNSYSRGQKGSITWIWENFMVLVLLKYLIHINML